MNPLLGPSHFTTPGTTNFYYSFLFLPREKRRAIEAVYAFARRGDDLVDGDLTPEQATREIIHYRKSLEDCYSGRLSNPEAQPELAALAEAVLRFRIPRQHFEDLILGLEMDLSSHRYDTFNDLALYCYRVASTIGLVSIEIFGYRNPQARDYAVNLGTALQLVNILRDLESDARRGRIYLPQEDLDRFGVRPEDFASRRYGQGFIGLMHFECDRARQYFERARQLLPAEDRRSLIAAEIMGAIYWRLLRRIQKCSYNVFGKRVGLPSPLKLWTALAVYLGADWQRRY